MPDFSEESALKNVQRAAQSLSKKYNGEITAGQFLQASYILMAAELMWTVENDAGVRRAGDILLKAKQGGWVVYEGGKDDGLVRITVH